MDEARALVKELLDVPAGSRCRIPRRRSQPAILHGAFQLAEKESGLPRNGNTGGKMPSKRPNSSVKSMSLPLQKDANFTYIPKNYTVPEDADYFHITTNNTIFGTEMRYDPDVKVPLVADMSSDIFSRPVDVSKYDIIYAGAQKNLAPPVLQSPSYVKTLSAT